MLSVIKPFEKFAGLTVLNVLIVSQSILHDVGLMTLKGLDSGINAKNVKGDSMM